MRRNCDFLFSVDDDVFLPPDSILKLLNADKDIVAGIYRLGQDGPVAAVRLPSLDPSWNDVLARSLLTPATYVSTGCMLVKRSAIELMIEKFPQQRYKRNVTGDVSWALYQPYIYKEEYLSEDWAFCQRAIDVGLQPWVHGGVKCGHMKKKLYQFGD